MFESARNKHTPTFTNSSNFFQGLRSFYGLKRLKFYYISLHILWGYVYSFCQIFQRLHLFRTLRVLKWFMCISIGFVNDFYYLLLLIIYGFFKEKKLGSWQDFLIFSCLTFQVTKPQVRRYWVSLGSWPCWVQWFWLCWS